VRDAATIVRLLAANHVGEAVKRSARRLRAWGLPTLTSFEHAGHADGRRLLAALLIPISDADLRRVVHRVARREEERQSVTSTTDMEA
jgi:CRISPR-associated protein Csx17